MATTTTRMAITAITATQAATAATATTTIATTAGTTAKATQRKSIDKLFEPNYKILSAENANSS